ncbi:hypothetical protein QN277_010272 [Acacia crassicarpa]|nr:hypothetical protein QN277_010272 [Acacia crassicarpa]
MEPLPSINKAFSLVVQQERELTGIPESSVCLARTDSVSVRQPSKSAYQPNNSNPKVCTYCGKPRHTIETCYKKHGFPPGYKTRSKGSVNNLVTSSPNPSAGILSSTPTTANSFISQDQYNQLIALLQPTATHGSPASISASTPMATPCVNQLSAPHLLPNADSQGSEDMDNDWFS